MPEPGVAEAGQRAELDACAGEGMETPEGAVGRSGNQRLAM